MMNRADQEILHLYKDVNNKEAEELGKLIRKSQLNVGTSYGNFQIDVKECFSDTGEESLRFREVGYGRISFMGISVYYKDKKYTDLFYRNEDIKNAVEAFIKGTDTIDSSKERMLKKIRKDYGKPKMQVSLLAYLSKQ